MRDLIEESQTIDRWAGSRYGPFRKTGVLSASSQRPFLWRWRMKQGFKVMDSDIHVQEPHDLWDRYIEPSFKDRAPRVTDIPDGSSPGVWRFEGKVFPAYIDRPERQRLAKIRRRKAHHRHEELGREVGPEADRRGEDPKSMLR